MWIKYMMDSACNFSKDAMYIFVSFCSNWFTIRAVHPRGPIQAKMKGASYPVTYGASSLGDTVLSKHWLRAQNLVTSSEGFGPSFELIYI